MSFLTDMDKVIERCLNYFLDPLDTRNKNSVEVKYDLMFFLEHVLERELYSTGRVCDVTVKLRQWDIGRYYVSASGYEWLPETRSRGQVFGHIIPIYFQDDTVNYYYHKINHALFLSGLKIKATRYYYEYTKDNEDMDYREGQVYLYPQFYIPENKFTPKLFADLQQIVSEVKEECNIREIRPTYVTGRSWTEEDKGKLAKMRERMMDNDMTKKAQEYWAKNPRNTWCPSIGSFAEDRDEMATGRRENMWKKWLAFKQS